MEINSRGFRYISWIFSNYCCFVYTLTFIPNLGPTLSVVSIAAMALLNAPWKALAVIILYIVI